MAERCSLSVGIALMKCVVPFMIPDTVKTLLAMQVAALLRRLKLIPNR